VLKLLSCWRFGNGYGGVRYVLVGATGYVGVAAVGDGAISFVGVAADCVGDFGVEAAGIGAMVPSELQLFAL
jgi:hypothetical protein